MQIFFSRTGAQHAPVRENKIRKTLYGHIQADVQPDIRLDVWPDVWPDVRPDVWPDAGRMPAGCRLDAGRMPAGYQPDVRPDIP